MKNSIRIALLLVLLFVLALPSTALARGLQDDRIVAGGSFTLRSGETQDGNLLVFGGAVTLEKDSTVNGEVVLIGGTISVDGVVNGNVVGLAGVVSLGENAVVEGDVTAVAATLNRAPGAEVQGQVLSGFRAPFQFTVPGGVEVPNVPPVQVRFAPLWNGLWFLFRTFLWSALAVLLVMFLPAHTERTAETILRQPVLAGAVGLLTAVVAPLLLIALAITIILIPVSLVGGLVLVVAWFLGRIALGLEIGRRMAVTFKQDWPLAVAAGIGTFVLTLVVDGVNHLIPCVGWLLPVVAGFVGLGGVLLSRFGTQTYPPAGGYSPGPAQPVAPLAPASPVQHVTPTPPDQPVPPEDQPGGAHIYDSPQ